MPGTRTSSASSSTGPPGFGPATTTCRPASTPGGGRSTATGSRPPRRMLLGRQRRRTRPAVESEGSGLGELGGQPDVVVADGLAVGEQLTVVVEEDHAVAQQPPALLGVAADHGGEVTRLARGLGAGRYVGTHGGPFVSVVPEHGPDYGPCSSVHWFGKSDRWLKPGERRTSPGHSKVSSGPAKRSGGSSASAGGPGESRKRSRFRACGAAPAVRSGRRPSAAAAGRGSGWGRCCCAGSGR